MFNATIWVSPFIDDASNWYVRRSRRRFWKSEDDGDKADAYRTLHYVLLKLSVILAPFTPFLAEELYQKMGGDNESVHLLDWPTNYTVDATVMGDMDTVRDYVNQGLSLRAKAGIKVRQPLANVTLQGRHLDDYYKDILSEELNVKQVVFNATLQVDDAAQAHSAGSVMLDTELTPELRREGLMREVIRFVQNARRDAGLNVDDRIVLALTVGDAPELEKAIEEFSDTIKNEVLAVSFEDAQDGYDTSVKVDGHALRICLKKV